MFSFQWITIDSTALEKLGGEEGEKSSTLDLVIIYIIFAKDKCNDGLCFEDLFSHEHWHWNVSPSEYPQIVTPYIVKAPIWTQNETSQQLTSPREASILSAPASSGGKQKPYLQMKGNCKCSNFQRNWI